MGRRPLTRAEFLKILAAGSAGVLFLGGAEDALAGITGVHDDLDQAALNGDLGAAVTAGAVLAVAKGTSATSNVQRAIAAVGGMKRFVHAGNTVVIKPNICTSRAPQYAATTNPTVVATLVRLARGAGASRVLVMDTPISADPTTSYNASGIAAAVKAAGGSMQVMGRTGFANYAIPGHLLHTHPLYSTIVNANVLINAPIAKQHGSTGLTLAGKNMMGCTYDRKRMHTLGLSQSIAEINAKLRPELTVMDAMRILVRNGPTGGNLGDVVMKNTVIACTDWVAVDAYATRLFGKTPGFVPYIQAATNMGLGKGNLSGIVIKNV